MNKEQIETRLWDNIDGDQEMPYIDLYVDRSCVDGWLTARQLRAIADAMGELAKAEEV